VPQDTSADILPSLQAWALVAAAGLLPALAWWWWSRPRCPLLPPQRRRAVPWGLLEVGLFAFTFFVVHNVLGGLLGIADATEGPQRVSRELLTQLTAFPIIAASCLLFPYATAKAQLYQFGLTRHRLGQNVMLGYLAWLLITPVVYGMYWLVLQHSQHVPHPIEEFLATEPSFKGWLLVVGVVWLTAPLGEELALRGLVQPCLIRKPLACDVIIAGAFLLTMSVALNDFIMHSVEERQGQAPAELLTPENPPPTPRGSGNFQTNVQRILKTHGLPLAVVSLCSLCYFALDRLTRKWPEQNHIWRGIVVTSVLFAALHPWWPMRFPLFALSLGLGWLRHRTQSLVGPIVMHFLFNVVGLLPFILKQMGVW
jgi:hypothetical protein